MSRKHNRGFRPDSILAYFRLEWLPIALITVSGLITGQDLIKQLKGQELGDRLLLPCNMLRSGEDVFLDDVTVSELEETLQVKIDIVKSSGQDFIDAVLKERYDE